VNYAAIGISFVLWEQQKMKRNRAIFAKTIRNCSNGKKSCGEQKKEKYCIIKLIKQ
jgi:hypothetical protein